MKKVGTRIYMVILSSIFLILIYPKAGWSSEWIQINTSVFEDRDETANSFQEAVFDANYLYVITSDIDKGFENSGVKDPNRKTILWASKIYENPNEWKDKVDDDPNVWKVIFDENTARLDRLFKGFGDIYAGIEYDGNCRIYRFLDPDKKQEVIINIGAETKSKWRVDNGKGFGSMLYIGIYDETYGGRVFRSNAPYGPIGLDNEIKNISGIQAVKDPNRIISLLSRINETNLTDERLFVGTRHPVPGAAVLSYTYYGSIWKISDPDTFNDTNISENTAAFLSMVEFMGDIWLLTEFKKEGERQWALWKAGNASGDPQWRKKISSKDPKGPFLDPNIISVSELQPIGEYLYLACLCNDGGRIWKSYHGENDEWIIVPSPSDPNHLFGPENLLRGIFFDPNDIDYIYAGTQNDKGCQILTRLVPRVDILNLTMQDRFVGPQKTGIKMDLKPNWEEPGYWEDPNHIPSALVFSQKDPTAIQNHFIDPNQTDFSLWELDPNKFTKEGIYCLKWELVYGKDNEEVIRCLSFAWDANRPSTPKNIEIGEGDGRLSIKWEVSSDSLKDIAEIDDPNFSQSIWKYKLEWWPEDDSNQVEHRYISQEEYSGKEIISNLQNNITYKVRVMAIDKAQNESGWSEGSGTPQETLGWLELLEEKGGCFISSVDSGKNKDTGGGGRWLAGLKAGRYKPASDEADLVYGDDRVWPVQAEIGWIHRSLLEVSFGTGYMEMDGSAIKVLSRERSIDTVTFRIIPSSMTLRWIPFGYSGHVLNPYLGGGIDAWWYQEEEPDGKDIDGWKYGYHGLCGIRMLLDPFDRKHARSLEKDFGVKDTYITLEMVYNWIDDFGDSRLDLGGIFYQAGILFLF
ncbi:MAG: fibronectin type III domain-containing protein [bacterium]